MSENCSSFQIQISCEMFPCHKIDDECLMFSWIVFSQKREVVIHDDDEEVCFTFNQSQSWNKRKSWKRNEGWIEWNFTIMKIKYFKWNYFHVIRFEFINSLNKIFSLI